MASRPAPTPALLGLLPGPDARPVPTGRPPGPGVGASLGEGRRPPGSPALANPDRLRFLARARRTALLVLLGLVAVAVVLSGVATAVALVLGRGGDGSSPSATGWLGRLVLAQVVVLAVLVVLAVGVARRSTRFLERVFHQEDRILSAVAHEVRSPLSRLLADLEQGLAGVLGERAALVEAKAETRRLAELVDDLLLAARVLAGVVPVPHDEVRLDELVRALLRSLPSAEATVVADAEPVVVVGSDRLLRLSLVNLVRNAAQHGYLGGAGTIRVRVDGRGVAVLDDGAGMAPDRTEALTDDARAGLPRSGQGMGLSLAKWVAELHGGRLHLENRAGGGVEARLVLPVEGAA